MGIYEQKRKRKYLNDIGIDPNGDMYADSFKQARKFSKEHNMYGFDSRETYHLNTTMYELLYERLSMYKERANKIIDLTYYTFTYQETEYTQIELIDILLDLLKEVLETDPYDLDNPVDYSNYKNVWEIWGLISPAMWW